MPEEYQLPVEGYYQQPPADPMGYALPVAQPIPADNSRIYISPKPEVIPTRDEPILHSSGKQLKAVDHDPWANLGMAGVEDKSGQSEHPLLKQLFGLGGEDRVQLWPERMVRAGVTAAGNVMSGATPQWAVDPETGDVHTSPQMIEAGLDTAALAGTGGLAGTTEATLGSGPFLRPALKHNGKIYKGKEGQQHLDVLPKELEADFNQKALSGEDISHYNFGFMNHKGQFLDREAALDYAVKEGLVDPTAGQYGALTSTLLSDSSKPGIAIEAMKKPTFYSALEHNVNNIGQAKMTGDQWLGTLANKPGVKPEELQWTGLKDFLEENKGKPVTKEAIQQHLEQNKVELKEVVKGNKGPKVKLPYNRDENGNLIDTSADTKYHSYQLPGGNNYREMLMTLPEKGRSLKDAAGDRVREISKRMNQIQNEFDAVDRAPETPDLAAKRLALYNEKTALNKEWQEQHKIATAEDTQKYKSSHWDEPNILAHVRMNDRTIEGKKSLHLEEIQSDWHQQGREKGYKGDSKSLTEAQNTEYHNLLRKAAEKGLNEAEQARKIELGSINEANKNNTGVPDAPFKKTWHELALKRMLREAAEKGYDRLSWTPGEAQAARYDLSKTVKKVHYDPDLQGGTLAAEGLDGRTVLDKQGIKPDQIGDFVGKDIAKKLLETKRNNDGIHSLEGLDLKVGGEGMKGFYDKMIPNALEKMGKEHGVKVKQSDIPVKTVDTFGVYDRGGNLLHEFKTAADAHHWDMTNPVLGGGRDVKQISTNKGKQPVHYIDIPQSLKDTVLRKGQPLFSSAHPGVTFSQVNHDPWEDKSK